MVTIVKRVVGAVLSLLGLGLVVVGAWLATQLGVSGAAEFTLATDSDPVLIQPDVLNRVDSDVVVTATPASGGSVWMALANPSDATAVVGSSRHQEVTGVSVRHWALTTTTRGSGAAPALGEADLWRKQDSAKGPVRLTVLQSEAPETLVIAGEGASLTSVTMTVLDKSWFVEAVVAALVGLFLIAGGVLLLLHRRTEGAPEPAAEGPDAVDDADAGHFTTTGTHATTGAHATTGDDTTTTEEVAR
ncbi:MAG: hypothetical protein ABIU87_08980 [Ornithinibacter sp.]